MIAKKNIPNLLTALRLILVLPICILMMMQSASDLLVGLQVLIVALFFIALITDYFDGVLARKWGVVSDIGAMLDPIADKLLVVLPLVMLIASGLLSGVHVFALFIIVYREFIIAGARDYLGRKGVEFPVTFFGKWKTALQLVAVIILLIVPMLPAAFAVFGAAALWLAAAFTLLSMGVYLRVLVQHFK